MPTCTYKKRHPIAKKIRSEWDKTSVNLVWLVVKLAGKNKKKVKEKRDGVRRGLD
jgi:hypothetical protein